MESVEIQREWVIQETEFQTKEVETIQELTGRCEKNPLPFWIKIKDRRKPHGI